jgi:ATP-binding cassette subfamily F protein 3
VLVLLAGAGKSTMLKILAKDFAPDSGSIAQEKKEVRMGFCVRISILSKEEQYEGSLEAFVDIKIVEKKLEKSIICGDSYGL